MRENWVDYAKGIGIVLVVFGHVNRGLDHAGIVMPGSAFALTDSVIYTFHMPLFFFLSGLFFVHSIERRGTLHFIGSKVDSLVYPFVVWSLLQGTIEVLLARYTNGDARFSDMLTMFAHPHDQFWFLYALFYNFVLFGLLYWRNGYRRFAPLMLIAPIVLYLLQQPIQDPYNVDFITRFSVFFVAGACFMRHARVLEHVGVRTVAALGIVFAVLEYVFHVTLGLRYADAGVFSLMLAFVGIALVVGGSAWIARVGVRWLKQLGELSMPIYLMHILAAAGVRIVLGKALSIHDWTVQAVAGTLIGLIAPVIAWHLCRRWRLDWLFERPRGVLARHKAEAS